jgi:hypothetical protein
VRTPWPPRHFLLPDDDTMTSAEAPVMVSGS